MSRNIKFALLGALSAVVLGSTAMAQTGNPNNPTGTEVPGNFPPKGNIGTSSPTTGSGMGSGTMAPGATGSGSMMDRTPSAPRDNLGASGGTPPSQVPNAGPKGNIGGN